MKYADYMEYMRSFRPVENFTRCDSEEAYDVVYPKSNDLEDQRLAHLVESNILRLYHREYRVASSPLGVFPPEIMDEARTEVSGGDIHAIMTFELLWIANLHFGIENWHFEGYYNEENGYGYDVASLPSIFAEAGTFDISNRGKPYRVHDLMDQSQKSGKHDFVRTHTYDGRVQQLLVMPYPNRRDPPKYQSISPGQRMDVYLLTKGRRYYDLPIVGIEDGWRPGV